MNSRIANLLICAVLAISTVVAKETMWHLGGIYWLVLGLCAIAHIGATSVVVCSSQSTTITRFSAVALLVVGQWWGIQMISMQAIWRLRGFSP
jgi:hypothetical protein